MRKALELTTSERCAVLMGFALVVFVFLPGPPYRIDQYDLPKDVALGLLGVASGFQVLASRRALGEDRIGFTLLTFVCLGALAVPLVGINDPQGWHTIGVFSAAVCVFLVARSLGISGDAVDIYWGASVIVFIMCALVLLEAYGVIPFFSSPGRRPGATLGNRNLAARLACLGLPILWNLLMAAHRTTTRSVLLTMTSVMVGVIVLSRSRGVFLVTCALVVSLPLLALWRTSGRTQDRLRISAFFWVGATVIAWSCVVLLPNRLGWSSKDFGSSALRVAQYQSGTGRGRVIQAETSWRMIRSHPFLGIGPGNWSVVYPAYSSASDPSVTLGAFNPGPQIPRNDILALIAEWGSVGFGVGLAFLLSLAHRTWRLLNCNDARARAAGAIAFDVCLVAALLGMFDSIIRVAPTVTFVALTTGVALGEGEAAAGFTCKQNDGRLRFIRTSLEVACALFSFALARSAAQDLGALRIMTSLSSLTDLRRAVSVAPNNVEARASLSYVLVSAGRCDLALPHINRAARLQPFSLFIWRLQDRCDRAKERGY